jgi:hypothetical protein
MLRLKNGSHLMSSPTNLSPRMRPEHLAVQEDRIKIQNQMDDNRTPKQRKRTVITLPSNTSPKLVNLTTNERVNLQGMNAGVQEYFSGLSLLSSLPQHALTDANIEQLTSQILVNKRFGLGLKGRVTIGDYLLKNVKQEFDVD